MAEKVVMLEVGNSQEQRVKHDPQQSQAPKPRVAPEDHLDPMIAQLSGEQLVSGDSATPPGSPRYSLSGRVKTVPTCV